MWQHLLTRKSYLVDLNEKYLIFKNVENFIHILHSRPRSTCEKMKHILFVPVNRPSYYYFPLRNLVIRQVAAYGYTLSPQTTSRVK